MAPGDSKPSLDFVDAPNLVDPKWYSHAVSVNGPSRLVFTSGQIGQLKDGTWPDTFAGQVKQAVLNLEEVLKAAGASPRDIIKLNFYAVEWSRNLGPALVEPILKLLTEDFGLTYRPITTLAPVPNLAYPEAKFEIEAVAAIGGLSKPWNNGSISINHTVAPDEVDVVVIGGGFSGLMAAHEAQSQGLRTILLEAKHRVGGRSRTQKLKSGQGVVELGATWINKTTQPKVYALVQKFGLETVPQYTDGDMVFQDQDGNILRAPDGALVNVSIPPKPPKKTWNSI
jgi:monoamine oxidase